jgi:outer membrane protein OmpA-like peptidoglycan-associated protein
MSYHYYGDERRLPGRKILKFVVLAAVVAAGWLYVRPEVIERLRGSPPLPLGAPATSVALSTITTVAPTAYATMPDGTPAPAVATFSTDRITLTGAVPSDAVVAGFGELVAAFGQPNGVPVDNRLTVDPAVPTSVGLRLVDTGAPAFAATATDISPEYAGYLDRLAQLLVSRPAASMVVVGHGDQPASDQATTLLSLRRAEAVVEYLLGRGVAGSRVSARASGDEASSALHRRAEFILHGALLTGPAG